MRWAVRQETVSSSLGPNGQAGPPSSRGRSPEITNATFRRDCHRGGKGAWTTAEQLRFLRLPPRRGLRSLVQGTQVRPEFAPECIVVRLPWKRWPAIAAFRYPRSSAAPASGAQRRGPGAVWRRRRRPRRLLAAACAR